MENFGFPSDERRIGNERRDFSSILVKLFIINLTVMGEKKKDQGTISKPGSKPSEMRGSTSLTAQLTWVSSHKCDGVDTALGHLVADQRLYLPSDTGEVACPIWWELSKGSEREAATPAIPKKYTSRFTNGSQSIPSKFQWLSWFDLVLFSQACTISLKPFPNVT